ncbi:Orf y [Tanacetum coccineum]
MNQNRFEHNSNYSGFNQFQPPQYSVVHQPPQETSTEMLQARENLMEAIQAFLKKYDQIPPKEKSMALLLAEERFLKIKQAVEEEHNQPEYIQELLLKLLNDLQTLNKMQLKQEDQAAKICIPYWKCPIFDNDDDEEYTIQVREYYDNSPVAITPVLPNLEPEDSLIMGNEEISTIPEKESDEFIKSSVEDLVPIPNEFEDTSGSDSECILPSCNDFSPINVYEETSVTFSNPLFNSNDDFTSSDDESQSDEDVLEDNVKIYSNPLFKFDDEYISNLLVIPFSDANEDEGFDLGGDIDKIDAFLDIVVSTDIVNDYYNSEGDIIYLESLLIKDTTPNLPLEDCPDYEDSRAREIPSGESKVHIEVLSVLWGNRLPILDGSLPLSRNPIGCKDVEYDLRAQMMDLEFVVNQWLRLKLKNAPHGLEPSLICEETNLVLNWEKCHFMVKEGIVLGHKISKAGIEVDKANVNVIASLPYPTNVKDECIKSLDILWDKLITTPVIIAPNWDLDFELMCDTSDFAVGAVLGQQIEKKFRPIYYSMVYNDHSALKYLFSKQDAKPRLISELKKLIENCKGKSVETQFNKPSVVRQPNAQRIPKPSVLGKPTPFSNSPEMRSFQTKQSVNKTNVSDGLFKQVTQQNLPQIRKQAVRNTNVIAPGPSRNCPKHVSHQSPREKVGSNDMVHNYYLEKAKKSAQLQKDKEVNGKPSMIDPARLPNTANGCKPKPRNWQASMSSRVSNKDVHLGEHRKQKPFLKFNELQCPTCKKCLYSANHDECVLEYLSRLNPRASAQNKDAKSHKTTKRYMPVEKSSASKKPERQIPTGHRFSNKKTTTVPEKTMNPRSCLRWKPTGRIFSNVRLRWIPTGKLLNSCTGKVDSEPTHVSIVDIPHIHACKQTLGLSAGTSFNGQKQQRIDLNADALYNEKQENLRVWPRSSMFKRRLIAADQASVFMAMTSDHNRSELGIQDHSNEQSSINPMIQPETEDLPKDNPKLEIAVLRMKKKGMDKGSKERSPPYNLRQKPGQYICCQNHKLIADIENDIMDPVMQCTTLPSHSGFSQQKLVSFVTEIHTLSTDISLRDC